MRILIVEDEFITARDLQEIIVKCGHECIGKADTYEKALHLVKTEEPELALVDISLKGFKDGIQFARALREEYNIIIIFVTAYADPKTLLRIKEVKPNGYVVKPFTFESIFAAIEVATIDHVSIGMQSLTSELSNDYYKTGKQLPLQLMKVITDYIDKRFNRDLPISELAKVVNLSEDYFSVKFKDAMGVSPHQYIMSKRLDEAKHLLRHTNQTIDEVATMVGYNNQAYFATIFKRRFGMTPTQYKKA